MIFDRNQSLFNSDVHKKIWEAAVMTSPIEKSTEFINDADLKSSCIDWYNYKNALYSDMYDNPDVYLLTSGLGVMDYNGFFSDLLQTGKLESDNIFVVDLQNLDKLTGIRRWRFHIDHIYQALSRQGMNFNFDRQNNIVKVSSSLFPFMFYAGEKLFESIQQYKNNGGERTKYLNYCDFRALQKGYKRDFDIMTESLSDERMSIARQIHEIATDNKLRQIKRLNFNSLPYDYKSGHVIRFNTYGNEFSFSLAMGMSYELLCDEIKKRDPSGDLISYFYKNISRCTACGGLKKDPKAICGRYYDLGGESVLICSPCIYILFNHCTESDIPYFIQLLDIRLDFYNAGI